MNDKRGKKKKNYAILLFFLIKYIGSDDSSEFYIWGIKR